MKITTMQTHTLKIYYTNRENCSVLVYTEQFEKESKTKLLDFLENIFAKFNDYNTNPLSFENSPENQQKIKELKTHTSMSIDDIVQINDKMFKVDITGFVNEDFEQVLDETFEIF